MPGQTARVHSLPLNTRTFIIRSDRGGGEEENSEEKTLQNNHKIEKMLITSVRIYTNIYP